MALSKKRLRSDTDFGTLAGVGGDCEKFGFILGGSWVDWGWVVCGWWLREGGINEIL